MIGNPRTFIMGVAAAIAWAGTAAAADCLAYIDARADHDEAVAAEEEKTTATMTAAKAAFRQKGKASKAIFEAAIAPTAEGLEKAIRVYRAARTTHKEAESRARKYWLKEKQKYLTAWDWRDNRVRVNAETARIEKPALMALERADAEVEAAKAAHQAAYDAAKKIAQKAAVSAFTAYDATGTRVQAALEEAKKQARVDLEGKYIEIYSKGRDVSGYRRESIVKAAEGEFLKLCGE